MRNEDYEIIRDDDGCELHNSCLNCPEPICIYDFTGYKKSWSLFKSTVVLHERGYTVEQISKELKIKKSRVIEFIELLVVTV